MDLPDGRGARLARLRARARVRRRRAVGSRRPAGVQDPPTRPQAPRGRRAGRLGREDDHRGRPPVPAVAAERAGFRARRRERRARQRAASEGRPLRDRVGPARRRGDVRGAAAWRGGGTTRRARHVRRGDPLELHVDRAHRGAEHAAGLRQGLLHGRRARERDDGHEGEAAAQELRDPPERRRPAPAHRSGVALPGTRREADLRQALVRLRLGQPDARRPAEPRSDPDAGTRATWPRCGSGCALRRCTRWARRTATAPSR